MKKNSDIHNVVIVGGGFGGVYAAKAFTHSAHKKKIHVTLIDRQNYFLFTPLLHEVATGGLSPLSVTLPLREIFSATCNVSIIQGDVSHIHHAEKKVEVSGKHIPYDSLVIATGAETHYRDIPGAQQYAFPLKTLGDARKLRGQIIDCFERAVATTNPEEKKRLLTFAVVGAGATGVEFAAELADFVCCTLSKYYPLSEKEKKMVSVKLLATGPEVLQQFPSKLRDIAEETLKKKRVEIMFNTKAIGVTERALKLENSSVDTETVVWTAGVRPGAPSGVPGSDRIDVSPTLESKTMRDVYVIGDLASVEGKEFLMLAQVAVEQGELVARNIERRFLNQEQEEFEYKVKGMIVSLGQWMAVGDIYGRNIHGRFMWWLWRTVYLFKFPSMRKRIKVALEWTINLFYPRDITKI